MMNELGFRSFQLTASGFCCSQIILKMALDDEETENADLLRAVRGMCNGLGGTQKSCGILTGALCIIGLYAANGREGEYPDVAYGTIVKNFMEWFEAQFGSTECCDIIGVQQFTDENTNQDYMVKCGDILGESYLKVRELLEEQGYEYGNREDKL